MKNLSYTISPEERSLSESALHLMYLNIQINSLKHDGESVWEDEAVEYVYEAWLRLLKLNRSLREGTIYDNR